MSVVTNTCLQCGGYLQHHIDCPLPNTDSNTVRERIEAVRRRMANTTSAISTFDHVATLCFLSLCDALLAERDAETAPEQTASEAWSEIARAGSGKVGKEGYADGNSGRAGRSEPAMTAKAHRAPATVPPNGTDDSEDLCRCGFPRREHAPGYSRSRCVGFLPYAAVPPTPARVERAKGRAIVTRDGMVVALVAATQDSPTVLAHCDERDSEWAPHRYADLSEIRAGEEIGNDRLTMLAELNRLQFCVGVQQKRADAAELKLAATQAELLALRAEREELQQMLKDVRDNAAEWELEAIEHQANAERLGALAASQGWVEGVVERVTAYPEMQSFTGPGVTLFGAEIPLGTRVLVRRADPEGK